MLGRDAVARKRKYQARVKRGLDRAFGDRRTEERTLDLDAERLIVFSDHHRGTRDGADDFWRCERAYHAALGHYLEQGYRLVLLGDVDELWENEPAQVLEAYDRTLQLEREFQEAGRIDRFWGNHDDDWRYEGAVRRVLHRYLPGLKVLEALKLRATSGGQLAGMFFLVHGHQGTLDSDRLAFFSRFLVRHGWRRFQRRFRIPSTTPARDFELRANHDEAMFEWARGHPEPLVLIAGHTHHPVFSRPQRPVQRAVEEVAAELERLRQSADATPAAIADARAELELLRTPPYGEPPKDMPVPCYFNTGCCSFGDGDVTGLEIADGQLRLVRWLNDEYEPRKKELAKRDLDGIFATVGAAGRSSLAGA